MRDDTRFWFAAALLLVGVIIGFAMLMGSCGCGTGSRAGVDPRLASDDLAARESGEGDLTQGGQVGASGEGHTIGDFWVPRLFLIRDIVGYFSLAALGFFILYLVSHYFRKRFLSRKC